MKWTEVNVYTANEAIEAVSSIFEEVGAVGVKIENALDFENYQKDQFGEIYNINDIPHITSGAIVSAYFPETTNLQPVLVELENKVQALKQYNLDIGSGKITTIPVKDDDWATAWKKYYYPVRVTRYLTVVPEWTDYVPVTSDEHVIKLDPGMAFGTGTHPTTRLCLEALEMIVRGGESMYDVGTGSGVLSIAAKHLGVEKIAAFDLDDVAVNAAKENLKLNPIADGITVSANDLLKGVDEPVELIVANILADIIVPLVPQAATVLKPRGYFITSGIIADKLDIVLAALESHNFYVKQILSMGEWRAVIASNQADN